MPKFAANLSMLYTELPFLDRFKAAAEAGFTGVEYLFPYAFPKEQVVEKLRASGLTQVLHNLPAGDWDKGERGIACHPDRVNEFQDGVGKAIDYASALGCKQVNCLAGIAPADVDPDKVRRTFVDNVRFAADRLKDAGITLLIEPVNTLDIPGFHLNRTAQALSVIEDAGSDNVFLQYDIYHMQIMEGDLARTIERTLPKIRHIQLADNPGRNEPGTGEINYGFLFGHLDRIGYGGWIGCEYKPRTTTNDGLGWFAAVPRLSKSSKRRNIMKVGFIGLGIMGRPMAGHLVKAGHELYVHDLRPAPQDLLDQGARDCRSGREVAEQAEVIITMVPDTPACRSGPVRPRRRRRGAEAGQDRRRHEFDRTAGDQEVRRPHQRTGLRLPGRAGVGRRCRRQGRQPDHHGRRA